MDRSGDVRIVARVPGNTSLHDIAPDGRLLIARTDDRSGISVRAPGDAAERDLSWLDRIEYRRHLAGRPAGPLLRVRRRRGAAWIHVPAWHGWLPGRAPRRRVGAGTLPRRPLGDRADRRITALRRDTDGAWGGAAARAPGAQALAARWLANGRNVVVRARAQQRPGAACTCWTSEGSAVRPVTPDGFDVGDTGWAVSPDGAMLAVSSGQQVELFPIAGGTSRRVPGRRTAGAWLAGSRAVS